MVEFAPVVTAPGSVRALWLCGRPRPALSPFLTPTTSPIHSPSSSLLPRLAASPIVQHYPHRQHIRPLPPCPPAYPVYLSICGSPRPLLWPEAAHATSSPVC